MPLNANLILVCTWLSLAAAVIATPNVPHSHSSQNARSLGHHAHPELTNLSHLPVVAATVDNAGKIETSRQKKKRAFADKSKRYYGDDRGFTRPSPLPSKRALILPAGWSSLGCVTEGKSYRALKDFSYVSSTMTIESCLEVCKGQGYSLGGLEWSDECYCGNNWSGGGGAEEPSASCNMPCVGSTSDTCGGYYVLSAYSYTAPNATTPLTASQCSALADSASSAVASSASSSALASASAASSARPSGASSVRPSASSSALPSGASSSALPSGFASSVLPSGGSSMMPSQSASANFSSLAPTASATGQSSLPTTGIISTEWEALGCYLDNPAKNNGKNILTGTKITGQKDMTQEICQTRCAGQGYNFAGLEYGDECWCGDLDATTLKSLTSNAPWCNMACTGNSAQTCGGGWSLQLFEQVDVTDSSC